MYKRNGEDEKEIWYLDEDNDGYHSEIEESVESPGAKWTDSTSGEDCDDNNALMPQYLTCPNGNCKKRTGLLYEHSFTGKIPVVGDNITAVEDNFRNDSWGIIQETNCGNGRIPKGSTVTVTNTTPVIRALSNGTKLKYYRVEYEDCEKGNKPGNPNYDANKPCSDCTHGDPIKKIQILGSTGAGIKGGLFGNDARKYSDGSDKPHRGYDIDMPVGTTLYNMFKGKIIQVQNNHAELGKWIIVESTVGGIKIQMWYAHMSDIDVVEDQEIDKNFILGESGESGNANNPGSAGPHLHLAARKKINGKWKKVDPGEFLSSKINKTTGKGTSDCD